jgi:aspartyl-tRNA(Asn)/glutamyl-tRNA(Gln) amidotransferase subunit A
MSGAAIVDRTLCDLARAIRARELSAVDAVRASIQRIESLDGRVGAFLARDFEGALVRAAEIDADIARARDPGPLAGVPIGVKDILLTKGLATTAGSKILRGFVPTYDATVVSKLRAAGAVIVGKLNCDEFAMGSSNENSAYHPVRNPWNLEYVPGGSSGGSAAAVCARFVSGAIGTDTGGSIRQPASLTGTVGLKPTYGRVSRFGVVAFASSLDQVGPMTRTVRDAALLLGVIAGHDPNDATSLEAAVPDYVAATRADAKGFRIGVPREAFGDGLDPEVRAAVERAIDVYRALGAEIHEVSLPHSLYGIAAYYVIATAEASSNLARYDGIRYGHRADAATDLVDLYTRTREEGFGAEVKRRIMLGTYALSAGYYDAYYLRAQRVRTLLRRDFETAFASVDAVLTPTSPTPGFRIGERSNDPLSMYLADIYTVPCNLAGLPGISIPCGFSRGGLPIGLQLLAKPLAEEALVSLASAYEQGADWHTRRPPCGEKRAGGDA